MKRETVVDRDRERKGKKNEKRRRNKLGRNEFGREYFLIVVIVER